MTPLLNRLTHKLHSMPVLVLMPHSRCNCRCVMCDIWKANQNKQEISAEDLEKHLSAFKKLKVKEIALSGGEALMHSNLWTFCKSLKQLNIRISLLSTGLVLSRNTKEIIENVDEVIVSIDGGKETHDRIRNIPNAFEKLAQGVKELKRMKSSFPVKGRSVLQKQNFREFSSIVNAAKEIGLDQISFLSADVSTEAFNREEPWSNEHVSEIALTKEEVNEFKNILKECFGKFKREFETRLIAESPPKLYGLATYYEALLGLDGFPEKKCNAPWVSSVIEADGQVRPCFFHPSFGNIHDQEFESIVNSEKAISFRRNLKVGKDSTCQKCVCSLNY
ncbi:MAG TPA: radical SAM protein [Cytophagales bacterium]|jgi:Fe-coproporphyrin III synthase|nr:radical SAM protein [Cytophagales bacterium]